MPKWIKWILYIIVALIILVIISVTAVISFIDLNDYKNQIEYRLEQTMGRPVNIKGTVTWSLYPVLGLKLHQVSVLNPQNFDDRELANFQEFDVGIKTLKLIWQYDVQIEHIIAKNGHIHLMKSAKGKTNWQIAAKSNHTKSKSNHKASTPSVKSTPAKAESTKDETSSKLIETWRQLPSISLLSIENTDMTYDDRANGRSIHLRDISLNIRNFHFNRAFHINLTFALPINNKVINWQLNTEVKPKLSDNQVTLKLSTLKAYIKKQNLLSLNGRLRLQNLDRKPQAKGHIETEYNPYKLITALTDTQMNADINTGDLSADIAYQQNQIKLTNITGQFDKNKLKGRVNYHFKQPATLNFHCYLSQLELNRLVNASGQQPQSANNQTNHTPETNQQSTKQQNNAQPHQTTLTNTNTSQKTHGSKPMKLKGSVKIDQVTGPIKAHNVNIKINKPDNTYYIKPLKAKLYNGKLDAQASLVPHQASWHTKWHVQVKHIDIAELLKTMNTTKWITGRLDGEVNGKASSQKLSQIYRQAQGQGHFTIAKGRLIGFAVLAKVKQALQAAQLAGLSSQIPKLGNTTPFSQLHSKFRFNYPHFNNYYIKLHNQYLNISGDGRINADTREINYNLVAKTQFKQHIKIPMTISGTYDNPQVSPDIDEFLQHYLHHPPKDLGKDLIRGLKGLSN